MIIIIIKVKIELITLSETLIIPDISKTKFGNCFIVYCFEEHNNSKLLHGIKF